MEWTGISKILKSFQARPKIKSKLTNHIIRTYLKQKTGIKSMSFKEGRLEIKVKSSALLQELFLEKENIKKEINNYLKKEIIKEVVVRRG